MAKAGDRFQFPDGSTYVVKHASSESDGESVEMEFILPGGCLPPPPHVHPYQVESYTVLEGTLEVVIDETWLSLKPGDSASVPAGTSHTFRNTSGETVRVQNWHRPAMEFEDFIQSMAENMSRAGVRSKRDPRALLYMSMAMAEYSETLYPARRRESIPMALMARVGRALRLGG